MEKSLKTLTAIIAEDDSRTNEDKGESTDNCIAALGKHVLYHFDGALITLQSVKELLSLLPLYADSDEAQSFHKLFFQEIIARNAVLTLPELEADVK